MQSEWEQAHQTIAPHDEPTVGAQLDAISSRVDQDYLRFVDNLLNMYVLVLKQRECYGTYLGISGPQYVMVAEIARSPGITVKELSRKLEVSGSFIAVEANKLIELEVVEKRENPLDGRSVVLKLSSKGYAVVAQLAPLRKQWDNLMYRSLDLEHVQVLQNLMERMIADGHTAYMNFEHSRREANNLPELRGGQKKLRMQSARLR